MAGFIGEAWNMATTLFADMSFFQEPVSPLPEGIDLSGKTVVITGGNAGLGLDTARQLLTYRVSRLILACRNVQKGEVAIEKFKSDPAIQRLNASAEIKVMKLDLDDFESVKSFTNSLKAENLPVDHLILNAGVAMIHHEYNSSGHERTMAVNFLGNALLINELLAHMSNYAEEKRQSVRITWVGSRTHYKTSLSEKNPLKPDESIIEHFDSPENFSSFSHYNEIKLLCTAFVYELAKRLDPNKVELNIMCPGMVSTNMSDVLPWHYRLIFEVIKALRARSVDVGSSLVVNAAILASSESHGRFLEDKTIVPTSRFLATSEGENVQAKVWYETTRELARLTQLADELSQSSK